MDQEHMEFPVFASFLSRHAESRRSRHAISSSLLRTVPACFVIGDGVGGGTLQHRSVRGGVRATAAIGRRQGRCLHRGTHVGSRRGAEGYGGQRWSHRGRLTRERERVSWCWCGRSGRVWKCLSEWSRGFEDKFKS